MKILWGTLIVAAVVVSLVVAGKLYTRSSDEAAFAQLPANYREIPVYPDAQNVWRGTIQDNLMFHTYGTRFITFTTSDPADKIMDFYRTTLENSGWGYDTNGHVSVDCHSYLEGDFYANAQSDYVWVAALHKGGADIEYQIFKVGGSFWMYGDCF